MTFDEFVKQRYKILKTALGFSVKARREGLLALEEEIGSDAIKDMEILKQGARFVVDGTDWETIEKILSNKTRQEKHEYARILKNMQKDAALMIQEGLSSGFIYAVLNSYIGIKNGKRIMTRDEFLDKYFEIAQRTCKLVKEDAKEILFPAEEDIDQENDEYTHMLNMVKKEAALILKQKNTLNPRFIHTILLSCTDITEEEFNNIMLKNIAVFIHKLPIQ